MNTEAHEILQRANDVVKKRLENFEFCFQKAQKDYKNAVKSGDEASITYYERELQSLNLVINELKSLSYELRF